MMKSLREEKNCKDQFLISLETKIKILKSFLTLYCFIKKKKKEKIFHVAGINVGVNHTSCCNIDNRLSHCGCIAYACGSAWRDRRRVTRAAVEYTIPHALHEELLDRPRIITRLIRVANPWRIRLLFAKIFWDTPKILSSILRIALHSDSIDFAICIRNRNRGKVFSAKGRLIIRVLYTWIIYYVITFADSASIWFARVIITRADM